jgi:hydroxymethylpyrimidine kinase/phosphomethylpyrimidine kinase
MQRKRQILPVALTIAGSDSGGGAGIQADLKTFAALGLHGTCAITSITAQNPKGVWAVHACNPKIVLRQIEAVFAELPPAAMKTGMLFSTGIIRVASNFFRNRKGSPLIVDPVMVATSGARLLKPSAVQALKEELLPLATLVTPNIDEAEILSGMRARSPEDLRTVARRINSEYGCSVLVKGGHLSKWDKALDVFYDGTTEMLLSAPFVRGISTHGTGCTYSAAIAGYMARGMRLVPAVQRAKEYITQSIAQSQIVARHSVLSHFHRNSPVSRKKTAQRVLDANV